jgi:hypothetical protein
MVYSILPVPFASAARQRQYEALHAALAADTEAPPTVLLGNLAAFSTIEADALVVRPGGLALLMLTPRGGHLTIPALAYGTWQLDGQPLPGREGTDNPFVQYQQQVPAALGWLGEQLSFEEPPAQVGLALFEAPLTFGPEIEAHMHHHPAAQDFHLLGDAAQVPVRLRQLLDNQPDALTEDELLDWADYLGQKLRQLWGWLGADDIPADPPYGGATPPPDQHLRDQQEQARLQLLRQELLAELAQQRQEAAARETSRTQELAQLRQQLAQSGQPAAARHAEQQAKVALEESLRTARAELLTRNRELDARIRQLEQFLEQVRKPSVAASPMVASVPSAVPRQVPSGTAPRKVVYQRLQQAERWGLVALALALTGAGGWGVVRWLHPAKNRPLTTTQARRTRHAERAEEDQTPGPVIIYDSVARVTQVPLVVADTTLVREAELPATEHEAARRAESAPEHVDSAAAGTEPPRSAPADSAVASPAP